MYSEKKSYDLISIGKNIYIVTKSGMPACIASSNPC